VQKKFGNLAPSEVKKKIYHYCAYQERCHQEVRNKLYDLGLRTSEVDEMISHLITERYLNEERFAKAFAGGKFRLKNWGKIKIIQSLESKGLTQNCIKAGLSEIQEDDYRNTIESLVMKKIDSLEELNLFVKREKISNYLIQKGFEPSLVWAIVKDKIKDKVK
jgi:regulatory protein